MKKKQQINIIEVAPRDGLQNEKSILSTADKAEFIELLLHAGHSKIEATSFVRAQKIPQMGDAKELMLLLQKKLSQKDLAKLCALVPNDKGMSDAMSCQVPEIAIFTATSDSFNQKNIHATVDESLERLKPVAKEALKNHIPMRAYISTVFGCPYEGKTSLDVLKSVANRLFDFGVYQVSFGDTIGIAHPEQVEEVITMLQKHFDDEQMAMHFHDTRGLAVANSLVAYKMGIRHFDSSAGGLGGCPYAQGASGNVATEDLLNMFELMNVETGIDLQKHLAAVHFIYQKLAKTCTSKSYSALYHTKG
jgi:hydroxymethylglutaryl-CoA lyase